MGLGSHGRHPSEVSTSRDPTTMRCQGRPETPMRMDGVRLGSSAHLSINLFSCHQQTIRASIWSLVGGLAKSMPTRPSKNALSVRRTKSAGLPPVIRFSSSLASGTSTERSANLSGTPRGRNVDSDGPGARFVNCLRNAEISAPSTSAAISLLPKGPLRPNATTGDYGRQADRHGKAVDNNT